MTETSVLSRFVNQVLFLRAMTLKDELSKGYYVVKKATATFESCDVLPLKEIHSLNKHWTTFSIEIIIWSEKSLFHLIVTLTFIFLYCSISYLFSDLCLDLWFLGISDLFFLWTYECFHFNCLQDYSISMAFKTIIIFIKSRENSILWNGCTYNIIYARVYALEKRKAQFRSEWAIMAGNRWL